MAVFKTEEHHSQACLLAAERGISVDEALRQLYEEWRAARAVQAPAIVSETPARVPTVLPESSITPAGNVLTCQEKTGGPDGQSIQEGASEPEKRTPPRISAPARKRRDTVKPAPINRTVRLGVRILDWLQRHGKEANWRELGRALHFSRHPEDWGKAVSLLLDNQAINKEGRKVVLFYWPDELAIAAWEMKHCPKTAKVKKRSRRRSARELEKRAKWFAANRAKNRRLGRA